jgi:hypothetical protein
LDLDRQRGGIGDPHVEPLVQIRLERVQQAAPGPGPDQQLFDVGSTGEALHGLTVQRENPADRGQRCAVSQQVLHSLVALAGAHDQTRFRRRGRRQRSRLGLVWLLALACGVDWRFGFA